MTVESTLVPYNDSGLPQKNAPPAMPAAYTFLSPLLAADRRWVAINWQSTASPTDDGADLVRCFDEARVAPLARLLPMIIPVSPACLHDATFIEKLAGTALVFIVPGASVGDEKTLERCRVLHQHGRRFGVEVDNADLLRQVPADVFHYLQFDASFARQDIPSAELLYAKQSGFRKIATSVASYEMFDWLSEKSFDWHDSRFLATRNPHLAREPDLTRLKLLKLFNLVKQDGDTRQIEAIFREEPKLSYTLLRLVNSVAVGARTRIGNFSQAIVLLGRRQLQRWLQLLIYADNLADGNAANPLMQLAAARGRQIELLSMAIEPHPAVPDLSDRAFMTGLFSLLEALINLPMAEILRELPLHDDVVAALSSTASGGSDAGVLSRLLGAVIAGEAGNFALAEAMLSELGISPAAHTQAQVAALQWASQINVDHHD